MRFLWVSLNSWQCAIQAMIVWLSWLHSTQTKHARTSGDTSQMCISDVGADQYIWLLYLSVSAMSCVYFAYFTFFVSCSYYASARILDKSFVLPTLAKLHLKKFECADWVWCLFLSPGPTLSTLERYLILTVALKKVFIRHCIIFPESNCFGN